MDNSFLNSFRPVIKYIFIVFNRIGRYGIHSEYWTYKNKKSYLMSIATLEPGAYNSLLVPAVAFPVAGLQAVSVFRLDPIGASVRERGSPRAFAR